MQHWKNIKYHLLKFPHFTEEKAETQKSHYSQGQTIRTEPMHASVPAALSPLV